MKLFGFFNSVLSKLTRVTSGGVIIKEIDGLRFVAIAMVLLQHITERFEKNTSYLNKSPFDEFILFFASRGFLGVYIFFVVSGFVLALPFASHKYKNRGPVNIKNYFIRRVTRLEPPFVFWMTIIFVFGILINKFSFQQDFFNYLTSIFYLHSLTYGNWSILNPPTWTLEIEVQFYILAPVLAYIFFLIEHKLTRRIVNSLILITVILLQQYFGLYASPYNLTILGHMHYFLIGFIIIDLYLNDWDLIKKSIVFDVLSVLSFFSLICFWSWDFELYNRFLIVILLFVFFVSVFKAIYVNRFITYKLLTVIGGMCYTIYLVHLPLVEFLIKYTTVLKITDLHFINWLLQFLLLLVIILVFSAISFVLFEKPFMYKDWPDRFKRVLKYRLK